MTILGPLDSAARRISCMGISNKLAWPVTTLFITLVIGKGIGDTQLSDLYMPFTIIIAIFLLLGVIALLAPLPDVKAAGEDESDTTTASNSYADGKTSILSSLTSSWAVWPSSSTWVSRRYHLPQRQVMHSPWA